MGIAQLMREYLRLLLPPLPLLPKPCVTVLGGPGSLVVCAPDFQPLVSLVKVPQFFKHWGVGRPRPSHSTRSLGELTPEQGAF